MPAGTGALFCMVWARGCPWGKERVSGSTGGSESACVGIEFEGRGCTCSRPNTGRLNVTALHVFSDSEEVVPNRRKEQWD